MTPNTDPTPDPSPTTLQRILEERARALARPLTAEVPRDTVELVVLALGAERYGVSIQAVQEIHPLVELKTVPGLPRFWAGLVNLHSQLYPTLALRRYLELPEATSTATPAPSGRIVLVAAAGLTVGLLVDEVLEVRRVPQAEIGPALGNTSGLRRDMISGLTSDLLIVLDLEKLLADPALVIQQEVG